jgi:hypothetical protein
VVFFNYTTMQLTAKIVYYGPGLCGKTTNLHAIHQKTASQSRGEMISLETETDRTLFFDLLPLDVGVIGGMKVRLQLYTVPGQVFYNATRKLVLKGVDGIVFVADSQSSMVDSNIESLHNLEVNLAELGITLSEVPLVLQYNKRDIRNILAVEELDRVLNPRGGPRFEAAALHGIGVFETLKGISRLALAAMRKKLATEAPPAKAAAAVPATPVPRPVTSAPARPAGPVDPLAGLLPHAAPEEIPLEFAEEGTDKHVRAVPTKGLVDIHEELEKLRTLASAPRPQTAGGPGREVERRLQDILVPEREAKQEVKRKASVEVPDRLLKGSSELRLHLGFEGEGGEQTVRNALTIRLLGNKRLKRLTLHIDLDIRGSG